MKIWWNQSSLSLPLSVSLSISLKFPPREGSVSVNDSHAVRLRGPIIFSCHFWRFIGVSVSCCESNHRCFCVRFVPIYRGPSHTFKVQRLSELSRYRFRIQAVSEAGEGPFSEIYSFTTTKSVPPTPKGTQENYSEVCLGFQSYDYNKYNHSVKMSSHIY